ncbi:hypothetical protein I7I48_03503 [Histoplasma ohiense]|nr:hypothetical protein I7I48_03503 [Histoplasma ohiense (nom. inval.)]
MEKKSHITQRASNSIWHPSLLRLVKISISSFHMQDYRRLSTAGSRPASAERHGQSPDPQADPLSSTMNSDSRHNTPTPLQDYSRIMHRHTQRQIERLPSVNGKDGNDRNKNSDRSPRVSPHNKQNSMPSS